MIIGEILELIGRFFDALLGMLGLSSTPAILDDPSKLRVFIKYSGRTVQVDLDPQWNVAKVKEIVAPMLQVSAEEIKIIFAGNELPDDFVLQTCDVGQQSYLHAVRVQIHQRNSPEELPSPSKLPTAAEEDALNLNSNSCLANRTRTFSLRNDESNDDISEDFQMINSVSSDDPEWVNVTTPSTPQKSHPQSSDFFVFCSQCEDFKEGKLRVRCATCQEGAFTVSQHPGEWADVIVPSRIGGSCGREGCVGSFAQFYFKCCGHVTLGEDDSSPPVPLVKRNQEGVPCLACGDVKEPILIFPCPLSHATCISCFKDYTLVKLNQREFTQDSEIGYSLGCPALCENSLIKDPHHFKLVGKYQYDRYQRFASEECLLQMGGLFCPQPDCGMGIIPVDSNCDKIACLHGCGYVFCRKCLEGWHIGPCRSDPSAPSTSGGILGGGSSEECYRSTGYFVSEDRAAAAQWGDATRRAMRLSTKPCPNCRVPTERSGGCMHMECTKCKFPWCWVCQTKWTRDCMGNHWFG